MPPIDSPDDIRRQQFVPFMLAIVGVMHAIRLFRSTVSPLQQLIPSGVPGSGICQTRMPEESYSHS